MTVVDMHVDVVDHQNDDDADRLSRCLHLASFNKSATSSWSTLRPLLMLSRPRACHSLERSATTPTRSYSWFYQLRQLRSVRRRLVQADAMHTIVHAFVTSRLDYCNVVLDGVNATVDRRLQCSQYLTPLPGSSLVSGETSA